MARLTFKFLVSFLYLSVYGCSIAPGVYIDKSQFENGLENNGFSFDLVNVTPLTISKISLPNVKGNDQNINEKSESYLNTYEYRIGSQDILNIVVWEHPELTIPEGGQRPIEQAGHRVDQDGYIFFPYVGKIMVRGLTSEELRQLLTESLSQYIKDPQISVRIANFNSQIVYVTGEVVKQGMYSLSDKPIHVVEIINMAGGATELADLENVTVVRGRVTRKIDVYAILQQGDIGHDIYIADGDIINIPSLKRKPIYLIGELAKPGTVFYQSGGINLADAISERGGLDQTSASDSDVFVIRQIAQNKAAAYRIDMSSPSSLLLATQFNLYPNDIVYVATADVTRWNRVLNQLILPTAQTIWTLDRIETQ